MLQKGTKIANFNFIYIPQTQVPMLWMFNYHQNTKFIFQQYNSMFPLTPSTYMWSVDATDVLGAGLHCSLVQTHIHHELVRRPEGTRTHATRETIHWPTYTMNLSVDQKALENIQHVRQYTMNLSVDQKALEHMQHVKQYTMNLSVDQKALEHMQHTRQYTDPRTPWTCPSTRRH